MLVGGFSPSKIVLLIFASLLICGESVWCDQLCSLKSNSPERTYHISPNLVSKRAVGHLDFVGEAAGSNPTIRLQIVDRSTDLSQCGGVLCTSLVTIDPASQEIILKDLNPQRATLPDPFNLSELRFGVICRLLDHPLLSGGRANITIKIRKLRKFGLNLRTFPSTYENERNKFYKFSFDAILTSENEQTVSTMSHQIYRPHFGGKTIPRRKWRPTKRSITGSYTSGSALARTKTSKHIKAHATVINEAKQDSQNDEAIKSSNFLVRGTLAKTSDYARTGLNPTETPAPDFTAAFIVFLALFLLCLPVIGYLVYRFRKFQKLLKTRQRMPYSESSIAKPVRHFSNRATLQEDATSFSSFSKSPIPSPYYQNEIPHITPYDNYSEKRMKKVSDHDFAGKVEPYHIPVLTQAWRTDNLFVRDAELNLRQIRVENWLLDTDVKKCGVGEVNLDAPKPCFVKILKGEFQDKIFASDDLASMSKLHYYKSCDHPNLVKFLGFCLSQDSLYIVSEFISSRSLLNLLISSRTIDHSAVISTLSGTQLMNFAVGISDALNYLHGNGVVHGSLNSSHVLLTDLLVPKLYDCCGENSSRSKMRSSRWIAPEVYSAQDYTEKADVWSFGILIWEILSLGGRPFHDQTEDKVPYYIQKQLQSGGSILAITRNSTKRLWRLLLSCWTQEPNSRPSMSDVKERLAEMKLASKAITVARPAGYSFFPTGAP